jgi:hypothetical protein
LNLIDSIVTTLSASAAIVVSLLDTWEF